MTGGAQGLSRGMAEGLMEAGAEVCVIDISQHTEQTVREMTECGYVCWGVTADLGNEKSLNEGFDSAIRKLGGHLDILVNGAGVQRRHPSDEFPYEDWEFVMNINLNAVFRLCQRAGRKFMEQYCVHAFFLWRIHRSCLCGIEGRRSAAYQGAV